MKDIFQNTHFSVLDLVPVTQGNTPTDSFRNSLDLAQHVENWGYKRFWISEHHNMESIASSATVILLQHIAQGTKTIRVGSGGIMLPNHAPLVIAEQFGTMELLFPGRMDLGLGRAPGTDQRTAMALRRNAQESVNDFPNNIQELQRYFSKDNRHSDVRAIPGEGLDIPLYLLGSSTYSAQLAAHKGLPYAFASHFAPAYLHQALKLYKDGFESSDQLDKPYAIACVNVIAAATDEEAERLATSQKQMFLGLIRGTRRPMQAPVENMEHIWNEAEKAAVQQMIHYSFIGSKATIKEKLAAFIEDTAIDEIMVVSHIFDHKARLRSYEILGELTKSE
ncbi:luciferase family oxidoreductase, group 1 [Gillisia sp. Hel1_33_143]|uniref:LLM class flavin-dependent oxidoreductase n=1 Tax=Gillisia sp. Hel1_33_143 TaxID=1336796 RepID=UPI00087C1B82|nr:LLM class flavin-dependent oxidoreductase [Gillisia sp. Hel1_33_143]SDS51200.1 luciferase family oxidoreductase, group 1 [Gillisia sp. Hel1_33_143]